MCCSRAALPCRNITALRSLSSHTVPCKAPCQAAALRRWPSGRRAMAHLFLVCYTLSRAITMLHRSWGMRGAPRQCGPRCRTPTPHSAAISARAWDRMHMHVTHCRQTSCVRMAVTAAHRQHRPCMLAAPGMLCACCACCDARPAAAGRTASRTRSCMRSCGSGSSRASPTWTCTMRSTLSVSCGRPRWTWCPPPQHPLLPYAPLLLHVASV